MMTDLMSTVMSLLREGAIDRTAAKGFVSALQRSPTADIRDGRIAIVGVAANMPGSPSYDAFWDVLNEGVDCNRTLPETRRRLCDTIVDPASGAEYLSGSWLDDIDVFDNEFFGITPADALTMDPQQRRFLEVAYHCLEDAGWASRIRGTRTGVYGSIADGDYMLAGPPLSPSDVPGRIGSFGASRLSYWLDLHGPAFATSCTCASSAVALHLACQGILSGDCEMALAGGANLLSFPVVRPSLLADASGIMSVSARSKPYDDSADGVGRGEGVIALMLKPLSAALRDRDRVRAVITATSVNNDGSSAMLTAPNPAAQSRLIATAWKKAGWTPSDIDYIEGHGTGTALGDPIEIKAINDAVRTSSSATQQIAMGTVKGNVGHLLDGAAGLAGVIKAMLVLEHGEVPPTINLTEPSRHIDFLNSAVFIPTETWPLAEPVDRPLRAGVNCFGFNGTNAHVLLEAPIPHVKVSSDSGEQLAFPVSALGHDRLIELLASYAEKLPSTMRAQNLAFTLSVGRAHLPQRAVVLASTVSEFRERCRRLVATPREDWPELSAEVVVAESRRVPDDDILVRTAQAWLKGDVVEWGSLFADASITSTPGYPFERTRFWLGQKDEGVTPARRPSTPLDICLKLVSEAVGYDDLSGDDSFLALGGSSLAAMRIQAALLKDYSAELLMVDILASDTIADMADRIRFPKEMHREISR